MWYVGLAWRGVCFVLFGMSVFGVFGCVCVRLFVCLFVCLCVRLFVKFSFVCVVV